MNRNQEEFLHSHRSFSKGIIIVQNTLITEQIRSQILDTSRSVRCLKKIFLDTKFWIYIRDAEVGKNDKNDDHELLAELRRVVSERKGICVISDDSIYEIGKNRKIEDFRIAIRLVDELTNGVGLISRGEREKLEILHYIEHMRWPNKEFYGPNELVWTKIGSIFGMRIPKNPNFDAATNEKIQAAYLQSIWSKSLSTHLDQIGMDRFLASIPHYPDFSALENNCKDEEVDANFEPQKVQEAKFIIHRESELMESVAKQLRNKYPDEFSAASPANEIAAHLSACIFAAFIKRSDLQRVPFIDIESSVTADIHIDQQRRFKDNDTYDRSHASAALPYCDYFLTEKNLAEILKKRKDSLAKKYNCTIIPSVREAIDELRKI